MPTTTTTTYMGIVIPNVLSRPGSTYASDINTAITTLDAHDHTDGNGVAIPAAGLDIDNNVSWGGYSITALKATTYTQQATVATANSFWFKSTGDAYVTNGSGTQIQLTSGSSLYSSSVLTTLWQSVAVANSPTIAASDTYGYYRVDTTAARTITLPDAATVGAGRAYVFQDVTGGAETFNITIAAAGSDLIDAAATYKIQSLLGSAIVVSTGTGWRVVGGNVANQVLGNTLWFASAQTTANISHYDAASGNGGAMQVLAQSAAAGNGGSLLVKGGTSTGSNGAGGAVTVRGGTAHGTNTGGAVTVQSGDGGATGVPGALNFIVGSAAAGSTQTMLTIVRGDNGSHRVHIGSGAPTALFGASTDTPSLFFSNAGAIPDRTAFNGSSGVLMTSVAGKMYLTLGGGDQIGLEGIVTAAVGGSQDKKITCKINGTTYYIPLHTA